MSAGAVTGALIFIIEVLHATSTLLTLIYTCYQQTPIDLVKTKLQIQIFSSHSGGKPAYSSVMECLLYILRRHGWRALWQGWSGTLLRNIPANALFFPGELSMLIVKLD